MPAPPLSDLRAHLAALLSEAIREAAPQVSDPGILIEKPKQAQHGDYACNVALQLARALKRAPREIAARLVAALPASPCVERAEVAGAGFINIFLKRSFKQETVNRVLRAGTDYGVVMLGRPKRVHVEFVSANPTGPLHVGHGRGAAYGASLSNILRAAGFEVTREYYVNDAGRQMDILALSTWLRYLERCGVAVDFPGNAYQGDYVRTMANAIHEQHGAKFTRDVTRDAFRQALTEPDEETQLDRLIQHAKERLAGDYTYFHDFALNEQLEDCRSDLAEFGITFDHWFSERSLYDSGLVERALRTLDERGHLYEQDGAKWFRSTAFGDEKDRVVQRENGQYTYFASDIAYHLNKFERGSDLVIDVWGADHHGYVARVKGALAALGLNPEQLTIAMVQFAVLYRNGQKVSMSTRAGEFVSLRQLRQEVGNDAARFFYVLRRSDQHLDFDLDLAKSKSNENPVYYVQYAHARVCSVLEQWGGETAELTDTATATLVSEQELALLARLMDYPQAVEDAARDLSPHVIAFFLRELAAEFHSYYNATRILVEDEDTKRARLALAAAVRRVLRNGLALLGVSTPERM
ncbi:MAG: arginine--tRNA ligase [Betaproteobacteria bacterium]|nr:arginine--tRNA ligase [Betaproteobacteria bacterium]MDH3436102.1 arginine--tRNA ligase [Betaproteobacteria bacterium]